MIFWCRRCTEQSRPLRAIAYEESSRRQCTEAQTVALDSPSRNNRDEEASTVGTTPKKCFPSHFSTSSMFFGSCSYSISELTVG